MKKLTTSKQGFAPILVVIFVFLISSIYLLAWAPWVTNNFTYNKALKSLDSSCRQLNRDEYSVPVVDPYWKQPSIPERLGLVPPFGREVTLYVMCNEQSSENLYFVSFLGTVKLKESKPIPHRAPVERSQNTIEKTDETANWKTFQSKYGYTFKVPSSAKVSDSVGVGNYFNEVKSNGTNIENNQEAGDHGQAYFNERFNLNISVMENTDGTTPDLLIQQYIDQLDKTQQKPPYQNANKEVKSKMQRTLKDYKNGEIVGKYVVLGYEYDYGHILMSRNGKIYIFNYTGDNGQISESTAKLVNQILSTFKFTQ